MENLENVYSITEAAKKMGIDRSTLHIYIREGIVKKIIRGKSPKITETEIKKYLKF